MYEYTGSRTLDSLQNFVRAGYKNTQVSEFRDENYSFSKLSFRGIGQMILRNPILLLLLLILGGVGIYYCAKRLCIVSHEKEFPEVGTELSGVNHHILMKDDNEQKPVK